VPEEDPITRHIPEQLRHLVETRAGGRCEYCRLPQVLRPFRFAVDHIIAIKHGGETVSENLALACLTCNLHKGSDIASIDAETGELIPLYNPRRQDWAAHFLLDRGTHRILGRTPAGRATVFLLRMNAYERIEERRRLVKVGWPY